MKNDEYDNLRKKLEEDKEWPRVYFFKFIIPTDNQKLAQLQALFGDEANVQIKQSHKGNYTSVSAKELMLNAENIINRYKRAAEIEGVMAL